MRKPRIPKPDPLTDEQVRSLMDLTAEQRDALDRLIELEAAVIDAGGVVTDETEAELDAATEALAAADGNVASKVDAYASVWLRAEQEAAEAEAAYAPMKRIAEGYRRRIKVAEATKARLARRLKINMEATGETEMKGDWARFALQRAGGREAVEYVWPTHVAPDGTPIWTAEGESCNHELLYHHIEKRSIGIVSDGDTVTAAVADMTTPLGFLPIGYLKVAVDEEAVSAHLAEIDDGIKADADSLIAAWRADGMTAAKAKERAAEYREQERVRRFPPWARYRERTTFVAFR